MKTKLPTKKPDIVILSYINYWKMEDHDLYTVNLKDGRTMTVAGNDINLGEVTRTLLENLLKEYAIKSR